MARAIWTGYISFGLVSVPVGLYSATQEHELDFHQFQRGTSDRIRYKRVNERTGREVDFEKIVKGHEVGDGEYVMVEPDELDDIAPGRSRSLEITTFVDLADVDPIHFQKSYYLAPSDEENTSSYALLREALDTTNRAGIARFVMRGKEYLAAIRADTRGSTRVMVVETMFFADEIRDPAKELGSLPRKATNRKQLQMAVDVVEAMSGAVGAVEVPRLLHRPGEEADRQQAARRRGRGHRDRARGHRQHRPGLRAAGEHRRGPFPPEGHAHEKRQEDRQEDDEEGEEEGGLTGSGPDAVVATPRPKAISLSSDRRSP